MITNFKFSTHCEKILLFNLKLQLFSEDRLSPSSHYVFMNVYDSKTLSPWYAYIYIVWLSNGCFKHNILFKCLRLYHTFLEYYMDATLSFKKYFNWYLVIKKKSAYFYEIFISPFYVYLWIWFCYFILNLKYHLWWYSLHYWVKWKRF